MLPLSLLRRKQIACFSFGSPRRSIAYHNGSLAASCAARVTHYRAESRRVYRLETGGRTAQVHRNQSRETVLSTSGNRLHMAPKRHIPRSELHRIWISLCRKSQFNIRCTCSSDHYRRIARLRKLQTRCVEHSNTRWQGRKMLRLDYVSCVLTILSTVLVGKKLWQGWVIAGANSIIICIIGMRTAEFGFLPGNLFCIGLYANNLWNWRLKAQIANLRSGSLSNT